MRELKRDLVGSYFIEPRIMEDVEAAFVDDGRSVTFRGGEGSSHSHSHGLPYHWITTHPPLLHPSDQRPSRSSDLIVHSLFIRRRFVPILVAVFGFAFFLFFFSVFSRHAAANW